MKFSAEDQKGVAKAIAQALAVTVVESRARMAIPNDRRYPNRAPDARSDVHQLAMTMQATNAMAPRTLAFLFGCVPDRNYDKAFPALDAASLEVIEVVNFYIQDRLAEDTDGELSCMVYPIEINKQPHEFPAKFFVQADFFFT